MVSIICDEGSFVRQRSVPIRSVGIYIALLTEDCKKEIFDFVEVGG